MSAIERGDLDEAAKQLEALETAAAALSGQKSTQGSDWQFNSANRTLPVHVQDLKGSLQSAQGRHEEAIKLLLDTVERERNLGYWEPPHYTRPALESLALAYTRAGKYGKADRCLRGPAEAAAEHRFCISRDGARLHPRGK